MDLTRIASVVEDYETGASEADKARLEFFLGLYRIEQDLADKVAAAEPYNAPRADDIEGWYWAGQPVLGHAPAAVDASAFAEAAREYLPHGRWSGQGLYPLPRRHWRRSTGRRLRKTPI